MDGPASDADERFRRLFEGVSTGIAVVDADGRYLVANPAYCATVGYTADELADTTVLALTHPDHRDQNRRLIDDLLTGRCASFTIEKRYCTKHGNSTWVRARVSLIHDECGRPQMVATTEDITEQKRVEARLEESEALLGIAGRVGRFGGWAIDADDMTQHWSDEVHDLTGYPRGRTPPLHESLQLHSVADRERVDRAIRVCFADATPFDLEIGLETAGGEPLQVRVVGEPRKDDDGNVVRVQGAILDVSEQRRAQRETDILVERLRTTMESITDALYTIDTDWRFTYLNPQAQELLQRDADDLLGRTVWETFPTVVGSALEAAYLQALDEDRTVVLDEYHYQPIDRYFNVTIYPSSQGLAVSFRDVTDKRATRVELEERGARLAQQAALLEAAQDAIVVRDLDGRISYWNRSAERIYGWTAEEAIGRQVDELLSLDSEVYAEITGRLLVAGQIVDEVRKVAKDGRELIIEAHWSLVRDAEGRPGSILGIDTDVTERKRIEEQFLRSQRFESIGKLAGGIAHDLNNALAPISMSIELLREGEVEPLKLRMLDIIAQSARHGAELVSQVLSFARGVDGRREPVSVGDIVEEVRRISADTFPKNITIEADVPPGLWSVVGDSTQIQQVLVNLCVNARDAMPDGGTLTLSATNIGTEGPAPDRGSDAAVALRIRDTGIGLTTEVREKMFEPFFSTKPQGEGTGLGLSTSAVIVASHGGRIEVHSEPGGGTTFVIRLPAQGDGSRASPPVDLEPDRGNGELILVADDEAAIRHLARTVLERFGYRVLLAADGGEALALIEADADEVALVLTDLMMPVMDGYTVIERLRSENRPVPIIASSGLHSSGASERALAAGAARFLAKPYEAEDLLRIIGEVLDQHAPRGDRRPTYRSDEGVPS